jgi:N6-adenosine-specific RNA methylase IME4
MYRTVVADPPWPVEWHGGGLGRHVTNRTLGYPTMTIGDIEALPVSDIAMADAGLFLWVTAAFNREGIGVRVARAWGFEPCGEFVWRKGMTIAGAFPRVCHEIVLVCRRGEHRFKTGFTHSVQDWRKPAGSKNLHSAKPDGLIDLVERVSAGPYVELFSRRARPGWDTWGHESSNSASLDGA